MNDPSMVPVGAVRLTDGFLPWHLLASSAKLTLSPEDGAFLFGDLSFCISRRRIGEPVHWEHEMVFGERVFTGHVGHSWSVLGENLLFQKPSAISCCLLSNISPLVSCFPS